MKTTKEHINKGKNIVKAILRHTGKHIEKVLFALIAIGFIVGILCPESLLSASIFETILKILGCAGLLYCINCIYIFIFKPIKRDWILAKGRFLLKVVNFVLLVPFILTFCFHSLRHDYSPKNVVYEERLYTNNFTQTDTAGVISGAERGIESLSKHEAVILTDSSLPDSIAQNRRDPKLLWTVYYHFIDPGNQHMTTSESGRRISALTAVLGYFLLNGLLISMLISWFDRRREQWLNGEVSYKRFLRRRKHYVIIGGSDIVKGIVKQIFEDNKSPYILIQTELPIDNFRRELFSCLTPGQQQHIILYCGNRTSRKDIESLYIEKAEEVYIIGEETRSDDIDSYHDTKNMECLKLVSNYLERCATPSGNNRIVCRVMFEYQTTFSVFQFYDIDKKVSKIIDFKPFNCYETWAQKVLINKEIDSEKITAAFENGNFLPLEGADGIKPNDDSRVHLFVVGMSRIGIAMAIEAAHLCHYPNFEEKRIRTRITFIDTRADEEKNFFMGRFKELFELSHWRYGNVCKNGTLKWNPKEIHIPVGHEHLGGDFLDIEWEFINGGIETSAVQDYILAQATPETKVTIAICLPESNRSHAAALYLNKKIYESESVLQVLVYNRYGDAIISAISDSGSLHPYCGKLRHYGNSDIDFLKELKQSEEIGARIGERYEEIRKNHIIPALEKAQMEEKQGGGYNGKSATSKFWSNVYNGNTVWSKLRSISYKEGELSSKEIEQLSNVEHNRWNIEQLLMNFRALSVQEQNDVINGQKDKEELKGKMAHLNICSSSRLIELSNVDVIARAYDEGLTTLLPEIYNGLNKPEKEIQPSDK